ncbi:MAG TPA: hypothetical protein VHO25_21595 [Polyangiaceae bacterium]|nr:hypothetical protein [Polyangiaceae bacterium]
MQNWFIATAPFSPADPEKWTSYVQWSGFTHLDEVVSLDSILCPTVLPVIKDEYWPHIVNEDYLLDYFIDLDFLLEQVSGMKPVNVLCVCRNPTGAPPPQAGFEFLGYDLVEVRGGVSALTNCRGFSGVFEGSELSPKGLLLSHARALEVQTQLRTQYPEEPHTDCDVWAISRMVENTN